MAQNDKNRPTDAHGSASRAAEGEALAWIGIHALMKEDLARLHPGMRFLERDRSRLIELAPDDPERSGEPPEDASA
jgi:hypothetical protein